MRVLFLDRTERGRRCEHGGTAVLGDHAPERAGVGRADRLALVEDRGAAVKQRRVDDVRMADHPADIGRRPIHFTGFDAVEILHRPFERDHVAAIVAHDALGPAGGAGRIENIERVGRRDRHAIVGRAGINERVIAHRGPVAVAAFDQCGLHLRPLQNQTCIGLMRRQRDGFIEQRLVGDDAAGFEPAARRQNDLRLGVVDPGRQFGRRKAAEHHRMNRADARAGEHRDDRLRDHRHVEDDAVALLHAEIAQHAAEHLRLGQQAVVADGPLLPSERRIVDDRRLIAAPGIDMAVDRVEAGVAHPAHEPAAVDAGLGVEHRFRLFEPVDGLGRLAPEAGRIALPARIGFVVAARSGVHELVLLSPRGERLSSASRRRLQADARE